MEGVHPVTRLVETALRAAATKMLVDYSWGRGREWDLTTLRVAGNSVCYPRVVAELSHRRGA